MPGNLAERWLELARDQADLRTLAAAVIADLATTQPARLHAVVAAYAESLALWRLVSAELAGQPRPAVVGGLLDRIEEIHRRVAGSAARTDRSAVAATLAYLDVNSAELRAEIRALLNRLDRHQPADNRAHRDLVAAWCDYDEATAGLRRALRRTPPDVQQIASMQRRRAETAAAVRILGARLTGQRSAQPA
jgi:hypothetical protein